MEERPRRPILFLPEIEKSVIPLLLLPQHYHHTTPHPLLLPGGRTTDDFDFIVQK
jgi:hypothetical protein